MASAAPHDGRRMPFPNTPTPIMMRRIITTLAAVCCLTVTTHAQSFLDHLQKDDKSKGSVSVNQSEDISKLVNGSGKNKEQESAKQNQDKSRQDNQPARREEPANRLSEREKAEMSTRSRSERTSERPSTREDEAADRERRARERAARKAARERKIKEMEESAVIGDNHKKVMSNSKKVSGYRIQVFAGGNTREDRAKAQEIGAKIKVDMPSQPVYVHFYSPRWCCRFGNFRRQDDANDVLKKLKKQGYKNACVVKTTISVNR